MPQKEPFIFALDLESFKEIFDVEQIRFHENSRQGVHNYALRGEVGRPEADYRRPRTHGETLMLHVKGTVKR